MKNPITDKNRLLRALDEGHLDQLSPLAAGITFKSGTFLSEILIKIYHLEKSKGQEHQTSALEQLLPYLKSEKEDVFFSLICDNQWHLVSTLYEAGYSYDNLSGDKQNQVKANIAKTLATGKWPNLDHFGKTLFTDFEGDYFLGLFADYLFITPDNLLHVDHFQKMDDQIPLPPQEEVQDTCSKRLAHAIKTYNLNWGNAFVRNPKLDKALQSLLRLGWIDENKVKSQIPTFLLTSDEKIKEELLRSLHLGRQLILEEDTSKAKGVKKSLRL